MNRRGFLGGVIGAVLAKYVGGGTPMPEPVDPNYLTHSTFSGPIPRVDLDEPYDPEPLGNWLKTNRTYTGKTFRWGEP